MRLTQDFFPMIGVSFKANRVSHGPGGDKQRRFFQENFGRALLEAVHGGVFPVDIVTHFGVRHGAAHLLGGLGHGVASQIDKRGGRR
jgi:hypothetical protein